MSQAAASTSEMSKFRKIARPDLQQNILQHFSPIPAIVQEDSVVFFSPHIPSQSREAQPSQGLVPYPDVVIVAYQFLHLIFNEGTTHTNQPKFCCNGSPHIGGVFTKHEQVEAVLLARKTKSSTPISSDASLCQEHPSFQQIVECHPCAN